ncbi:MAG: hypothetical protein D6689_13860 [Deltaproteobacteria bacterium]|nr:MAG: hypothetical protein D6689_13860 [Deltaproteobacteria bacterium]
MSMVTRWTWIAAGLAVLAAVAPARAQKAKPRIEDIVGDYKVKFDEIANNCTQTGMSLRKGVVTLAIDRKGNRKRWFSVSIPIAPVMFGSEPRDGKFRVRAPRAGTGIRGVLGEFNASGRAASGVIQFVYIAEFFTKDGKPLCTQSWNVSGVKQ